MKDLYVRINAKIKIMLGVCNTKGCYKRARADVYFPQIDTTRCLCDKHLLELKKMELINSINYK